MELAALMKPFIYFPIEGHFEQEIHVSSRLERYNVGERMKYSVTDPVQLADKIVNLFGKKPSNTIPVDGASKAAKLINQLF